MNLIERAFEGRSVRVAMVDGAPWFVAKDVCEVLDISDIRQAVERLDEDERGLCSVPTPGGEQQARIVSESGLYSLVLTSRKPEAVAFKRWITHEVIPSIRKTGRYIAQTLEERCLSVITDLKVRCDEQQRQLAEARPKVEAHDAFMTAEGSYSFRDAGKLLGLGGNRFAWWLEANKFLYRSGDGVLLPYQREVERGLFVVRAGSHTAGDQSRTHRQCRVTPKGVDFFRARIADPQGQLALVLS